MRINQRNYGRRFSIILDTSQLRELAKADADLLGDMVDSAERMVKKLGNEQGESGQEESGDSS